MDVSCDLHEAFVCALLLHLSLDDVNRIVTNDGAEASESTSDEINRSLLLDVTRQEFLGVCEDHETNGLIRRLLHDGGHHTLIETSNTSFTRYGGNTREDIFVLWRGGQLVVNELGLERFLRSDDSNSLSTASAQTAHESVHCAGGGEQVGLCVFVSTETHGVLGHREEEQGGVTAVEAEEALVPPGFLGKASHAELELGLVDLQDSLQILSWVSARNLNCTDNTADKAGYDWGNFSVALFGTSHLCE